MSFSQLKPVASNGFVMNMRTDYRILDQTESLGKTDEHRDVKRGEAVVVYEDDRGGRWRDNHTHGVTVYIATKRWKCLGVAASHCNYSKDINADRGFTCQIGGLITVINESGNTIKPGMRIRVVEPGADFQTKEKGIPKNKKRFFFAAARATDVDNVVGTAMGTATIGQRFDLNLHRVY